MTRGFIVGALKAIETDADKNVGKGASEETILRAEVALGLRLPPSYRAFLKEYGHGGVRDVYVLGLCDSFDLEDSSFPNLVGINLAERASGLPGHVLLIEGRDEGSHYALDFSTCDNAGETDVVVWKREQERTISALDQVAGDFGEFLARRIASAPKPAIR